MISQMGASCMQWVLNDVSILQSFEGNQVQIKFSSNLLQKTISGGAEIQTRMKVCAASCLSFI